MKPSSRETSETFPATDFLPAAVEVEGRQDGTLILRSPEPLAPYARCLGEFLEKWAKEKPDEVFLAQRDKNDNWRKLTWAEAYGSARKIASFLLTRNLSAERPVAILSENSFEYALLKLAVMHVGIPLLPISPSYALMSKDFVKLKNIFELMTPGLVLVEDGKRYAPAIKALADYDFELVAVRNGDAISRPHFSFENLLEKEDEEAVDRAFATINPDTIVKFLLTSGSTGEPKAVINTQRMLCSNQQALAQTWKFIEHEPLVLVDWLPWHHTFGGNNNFNLILTQGGTFYIDGGKPTPQLIEKTVRNLKEISPTIAYNAPRGYDALIPYLESDTELRHKFFARLKFLKYAAAALSASLWERLERLSFEELGRRVPMGSGWGATETAPTVTLVHFEPLRPSVIGLPIPGCELKMVPTATAGKYELRVKGANVTPGYWKRPELTAAAFDEEGFYKIGDAGTFADPNNPAQGIEFAGRLAEEFKLSTGTWVHVGALRVRALSALAPIAQDIVITGQDRNEIGFLIFPSEAGCRSLFADCENKSLPELLSDSLVKERVLAGLRRLKKEGGGSSTYATRAMFLEEPPVIDAGEITDKGYINQHAVLERRAALVEKLYDDYSAEITRL